MLFLKKSYFSEKILVTQISPRNLNLMYLMKIVPIVIGINNLYTHFVFITHPEYSGKNTLLESSKITHQNSMPFMPTPNMYICLYQDYQLFRKQNWQRSFPIVQKNSSIRKSLQLVISRGNNRQQLSQFLSQALMLFVNTF